VPALVQVILKDAPGVNSMSAVLVVANVAGHLSPAECPAVTKDLQIAIKVAPLIPHSKPKTLSPKRESGILTKGLQMAATVALLS
jgi:hypothetical protein